jgi:hypothetical protein
MNTNIRNVGAAVGAGIATSVVVSAVMANGIPAEHGYVLAFAISAAAMLVAAGAAALIPRHAELVEQPTDVSPALVVAD